MKCYRPFVYNDLYLPCGKCAACLANKKIDKLSRVRRVDERGVFFTLTYDQEHVPFVNGRTRLVFRQCGDIIFPDDFAGKRDNLEMDFPTSSKMVLLKYDIVNFIKRLRKNLQSYAKSICFADIRFGYYICGEYSPVPKSRPHYHGLLFCNCTELFIKEVDTYRWLRWEYPRLAELISKSWPYSSDYRITRYTSEIISGAASDYVSKYIGKSGGDCLLFAPFGKMSQRLGSSRTFVRGFFKLFLSNFGIYSRFSASPLSVAFLTPTNMSAYLAKPYRLLKNGIASTYSRVKLLVGKKCKECEHTADFSFIRCWHRFNDIMEMQLNLLDFLTLIYNFYEDKALDSLRRQYVDYDPINYNITWEWLYNMPSKRAVYSIYRYCRRINISVEDFLGFEQRYFEKFSLLLTQSNQFHNQKLYTLQK